MTDARMLLAALTVLAVLGASACDAEPDPTEPGEPADQTEPQPEDPEPEPEPQPEPEPEPEPEPAEPEPEPDPEPVEEEAAETLGAYGVSAGHPAAVEVGMDVLEGGGNAVDAAIAAAYAVSVVEPFASGVGGGGAALVHQRGEEPLAYDYREVVAQNGEIPASNTGIPGFVAGMETLHAEHGSGDLADLLAPATALAADGVEVSGMLAERLESAAGRLPVGEIPHFFRGGTPLRQGDTLVQEELAGTLDTIAEDGAAVFYDGALGEQLAGAVTGIDTDSLAAYDVARPEPARGRFADHEVIAAGPPLPGVTLVQILQIAEALGVGDHEPGSADFVHTLGMAWRVGERSLTSSVGDPDFVDVPVERLTDPDANAALAEHIPPDGIVDPGAVAAAGDSDPNTTHITVVDTDGTVVSMTNTITNFWGSGNYTLGFFLNDQLNRFSSDPGSPNAPEPGKRAVSWSTPALVADADGRPVLGVGSPGGRRIPLLLAQVVARWAAHGQDLADAVAAPRFHLEDTTLEFEEPPPSDVADDLLSRGYSDVAGAPFPHYYGSVTVLEVDVAAGDLVGATDTRREGDWAVAEP